MQTFRCCQCDHTIQISAHEAAVIGEPACPKCGHEWMQPHDLEPHHDFEQFLQDATLMLNELWEDQFGGSALGEHDLQTLNDHLNAFFADKQGD